MAWISKKDVVEIAQAARQAFTWSGFLTALAVSAAIGLLGWLASQADSRYRPSCAEPGDAEFLMFFLALPLIASSVLVGLGEAVLWSRSRAHHPVDARQHLRRAVLLLATGAAIGLAAAVGFLELCHYF